MLITIPKFESLSSKASDKAKKLGLAHQGFGKYTSSKGVKYITRNGELWIADKYKKMKAKPSNGIPDTDEDEPEDDEQEEGEEQELDEDGNPVEDEDQAFDEDGNPASPEDEFDEDGLLIPKYDKDGNTYVKPEEREPEPEAEAPEYDDSGKLVQRDEKGNVIPSPSPDHHMPLSQAPAGMDDAHELKQEEMRNGILEGDQVNPSPDTVNVDSHKVRLKRTREIAADAKKQFGNTINSYKSAFSDLAADVKGFKPFQEVKDDWVIGDDGTPVDPLAEQKKAERKKVLSEVGGLVLAGIGVALFGPLAGIMVALVAQQYAEKYADHLDAKVKKSQERVDDDDIPDADLTDIELAQREAKKRDQEIKRKARERQEEVESQRGVVRRGYARDTDEAEFEYVKNPKTGEFKKVPMAQKGTSQPKSMRNRGYKAGPKNFDPYADRRFDTYVSSAGNSDAELDNDMMAVINDYKYWLKGQDVEGDFDKAYDVYNGNDSDAELDEDELTHFDTREERGLGPTDEEQASSLELNEDGTPVEALDEDGNPVEPDEELDEDGNPIEDSDAELDEDGNPVEDSEDEEEESDGTEEPVEEKQ